MDTSAVSHVVDKIESTSGHAFILFYFPWHQVGKGQTAISASSVSLCQRWRIHFNL